MTPKPLSLIHRTTQPEGDVAVASRSEADQPGLVVLHGFLGGSRSWSAVARKLARYGAVHTLDLRNHGRSPHSERHDYPSMAADVAAWIESHFDDAAVTVMGHSMGGKVAMKLACERPELVHKLYALDIAPVDYPVDRTVMDALLSVDLSKVATRSDAEHQLAGSIPDRPTRLFLLTNLNRHDDDSGYRWTIPLEVFDREVEKIFVNPLAPGDSFRGPAHFISGAESSYVSTADFEKAQRYFPAARWTRLDGVGHNVHTEGGEAFLEAVGNWAD